MALLIINLIFAYRGVGRCACTCQHPNVSLVLYCLQLTRKLFLSFVVTLAACEKIKEESDWSSKSRLCSRFVVDWDVQSRDMVERRTLWCKGVRIYF